MAFTYRDICSFLSRMVLKGYEKNIKRKIDKIGIITLGDRVHVSDPCYETDCWCAGTLENVLPGQYMCKIVRMVKKGDKPLDGQLGRVKELVICHESYQQKANELTSVQVDVDSGQAGFYDLAYYQSVHPGGEEHLNEEWYERVSNITQKQVANPQYMPCKDYIRKELGERYLDWNALSIAKTSGQFSEKEFSALWEEHSQAQMRYMEDPYIRRPSFVTGYAGILDNMCCVASSGYGDGGYDCYVGRNDEGKIVSARIQFI